MRKILVMLAGSLVTLTAHAEFQTVTVIPPTTKVDNSPLNMAFLKSWRLQCGLGPSSPAPGGWIINDEITFPTTAKGYNFTPDGQWNCHAWVTTTYSCASLTTPDGAWTFSTTQDAYGNAILLNGSPGVNGNGLKLVYTGGKTWALADKDATNPQTWWRWDGVSGWAGPLPAPTIAATDPQLTPITPPLCQSGDTPDLVFTIPMNSPQVASNAKPNAPSISISHAGAATPTP